MNDARSFFRTTDGHFDLIVYGLLDSYTPLSRASSVRLDSFVYTVEGIREACTRLKDDGVLSLVESRCFTLVETVCFGTETVLLNSQK